MNEENDKQNEEDFQVIDIDYDETIDMESRVSG